MTQHSVVRCVEIVGEAASRISPELREANADIPWQDIIGMRDRIVHAYFDIDSDLVWVTARYELLIIIARIEIILSQR